MQGVVVWGSAPLFAETQQDIVEKRRLQRTVLLLLDIDIDANIEAMAVGVAVETGVACKLGRSLGLALGRGAHRRLPSWLRALRRARRVVGTMRNVAERPHARAALEDVVVVARICQHHAPPLATFWAVGARRRASR